MNLHHYYTGARVAPFASPVHGYYPHVPQGFCRSCGHPSAQCGCGCRTCRKEAKELLVKPGDKEELTEITKLFSSDVFTQAKTERPTALPGIRAAFIGGGCCVHIAVEYAPASPTADSSVLIVVKDSAETLLAWQRVEKAGTHYQVKENIIATNPGATLNVLVNNMVARVRWCEVFSC